MLLLLAILIPPTQADRALDRNAAFMATIKSISVEFKIALVNPAVKGAGKLTIEFPRRTRFTVKIGPANYDFAATEQGAVEIEHSSKYYMEDSPPDFAGPPESKISQGPAVAFPQVFISRSVRGALPPTTKYTYAGQADVNGRKVDKIEADWVTQGGEGHGIIHLDQEGRILKFGWKGTDMGAPVGNEFDFFSYAINKPVPASTFKLDVPNGYVPFVQQRDLVPPEIGTTIKLGKWQTSGAKPVVDLDEELAGKPALLFVMSPDCVPSSKAIPMVESLAKQIKVVWLLSDTAQGVLTNRARFFFGGEGMKMLQPAATPSFYLLSSDGKLNRYWFGFDPKTQKQFESDMVAAIKELR